MNDMNDSPMIRAKSVFFHNLPLLRSIAGISILILAVSGMYAVRYNSYLKKTILSELSSIADLKIADITAWNRHQFMAAQLLSENPGFAELVRQQRENGSGKRKINYDILHFLHETYGSEVTVFSNDGKPLLSYPDHAVEVRYAEHLGYITEVIRTKKIVFADFHRHEPQQQISLGYFFPILETDRTARPLAVGFIRVDPSEYLYPLIQSWPTPSKSAETLLFRREGDSVLFLNELRHRKNTALLLRIPLSQKSVLAVQGALKGEGVFEGVDYGGVSVIGVVRHVPGTPWMMISKVSKDEIFASVLFFNILMTIAVIFIIVSSAGALLLYWRRYTENRLRAANQQLNASNQQLQATEQQLRASNQQLKAGNQQLRAEMAERRQAVEALRSSEERFHSLFDSMAEGVALHELVFENGAPVNYRIIDVNNRFMEIIGISREQVADKLSTDAYHVPVPPYFEKYVAVSLNKRPDFFETYFPPMDKHFAISAVPWHDNGFATIFTDITERRRAEEKIRDQLNELQRWQDVMLGREGRIQELKCEVNELCRRSGEDARYPSQESGADGEMEP